MSTVARRRAIHELTHPVDNLGLGRAALRKMPDQYSLSVGGNLAIARKRRQYLLVPQVLAPRLEFLWGPTEALAELRQCLAKGMWIGIRPAGAGK
jgi:hypothetical protein